MSVEYVQHALMVKQFQGKWFIKPSQKYVWHTWDFPTHLRLSDDTGSWHHSQEIPSWSKSYN